MYIQSTLYIENASYKAHNRQTGVSNRWTGTLDWTTGLDYWTQLCCTLRMRSTFDVVVQLCNDGRMHLSFSLRAG